MQSNKQLWQGKAVKGNEHEASKFITKFFNIRGCNDMFEPIMKDENRRIWRHLMEWAPPWL